jgi:hypothetical protein
VHAIEKYSEQEWEEVWKESGGRVCGLLCEELPPQPRSRRAVLLGALLTAISPLMAQSGRVRIMVTDPTGTVIPTAQASLLGSDNKPTRTEHANERGEIVFADLPLGDCRFAVTTIGFATSQVVVTLRNGDEVKIETSLQVGLVGEFVTVQKNTSKPNKTPTMASPTSKRKWWQIFR